MAEFLRAAVRQMLVHDSWSALFATKQEKGSCKDALVVHRALHERFRSLFRSQLVAENEKSKT